MLLDKLYPFIALVSSAFAIGFLLYALHLRKCEKKAMQDVTEMKNRFFSTFSQEYLEIADMSVPVEYASSWKSGDIVGLVSRVCRSCEPYAEENGIRLVYDHLMEESVEMEHIPFYTQKIVEELVSNAIRFSPSDSEVLISTRLKDSVMQIFVSDRGIGMTVDQKANIFQPFYQVGTPKDGCIGIGLPMVKLALDAMDGHIDVYSFPDIGSTFIVSIPVKKRCVLDLPRDRESTLSLSERSFVNRFSSLVQESMANGDKIDYDAISRSLCVSRTHLNRKLKAITGQTTSECVLRIRMSVAKRLLDDTDIPIGDVAFRCGMEHFTYFSALFKKTVGMTPSQYKKRNR